MKQFLIPSGDIQFHGTLEQLLEAFRKAGGVMEAKGTFRCTLPPPSHRGIEISLVHTRNRGIVLFQFLCEYEPTPGGFRVRYRVVPTCITLCAALLPVVLSIGACYQFAGSKLGLYPLWIAGMVTPVILLMLLWERTKQMDQFREILKTQFR